MYTIKALEFPLTSQDKVTLSIKWQFNGDYDDYSSDKSGTHDSLFLDKLKFSKSFSVKRHYFDALLDVEFSCTGKFRYTQGKKISEWVPNDLFPPMIKIGQILCDKNQYQLIDPAGATPKNLGCGFYCFSETGKLLYMSFSNKKILLESTPF